MLLLWVMVGLTVIALLILNILLYRSHRRTKAEQRLHQVKVAIDRQAAFLRNCEKYQLSSREIDVLRLILEGHTYKTAADILFISEKTVDGHLRNVYTKSGVKNKVELVIKFHS
jgi:DNA-binding CsgD family transcriptional regulator